MPPESTEIPVKSTSRNSSSTDTWKKAWLTSPGPKTFAEHAYLFLKGVGMGTADIVPGVSGGTIAFITGIYEELLTAISSINSRFILQTIQLNFKQALANRACHIQHITFDALPADSTSYTNMVSLFRLDHCVNYSRRAFNQQSICQLSDFNFRDFAGLRNYCDYPIAYT